jgi:hypothetical protein
MENETTNTMSPIDLTGNRIKYSKEDVDQFILQFGKEAPSLLAQDAVMSFSTTDYKDQMKNDPNFLTYQGLKDGTATILNLINDPKMKSGEISGNFSERPDVQRKMTDSEILKFFTTLNDVDIEDTITRELFRALPSAVVFGETVKRAGKLMLKGGPPKTLPEAAAKFLPQVFAGLATSTMTYSLADQIDELVLGAESVTTPGQQRAIKESLRTLTGGSTGLIFPFMIPKNLDWGTKAIIDNLADDVTVPAGVRLSAGVENFFKNYSTAYRGSPTRTKGENIRFGALTATGDASAVIGASAGAYGAEKVDPGATGTRLLFEIGAGSSLPVLATKASTSIANFVADKFSSFKTSGIEGLKSKAQENQINKIVQIFERYEKDPVAVFEALSEPNNIKTFNEIFPEADFTPTVGQDSDELLLTIIESSLRKTNADLDIYAQNTSTKMRTGIVNFLKLMGRIDDEPKEAFGVLSEAAKFRRSAIEFAVGTRVKSSMNKLGQSLDLLNVGKKGASDPAKLKLINKKISELLNSQINKIRNEERKLWTAIENKDLITEIDPDDPPYFIQSWMSNKKPNPATDIEKDIALRPLARFFNLYKSKEADPTIDSLIEKINKDLKTKNVPLTSEIEKILKSRPESNRRIDVMPNSDFKPGNALYESARYDATGTLVDGRMESGQVDYYQMFNGTITPRKMFGDQPPRTPTDSTTLITQNKILQTVLDDPRVKLTEKEKAQISDYMLYTDSQILRNLKREEAGGATFFNDDPELRFSPIGTKFLKDKGVTGKEPEPFKPITIAQLVDIRRAANQLAREYSSGPNPNKDYARIAGEFSESILQELEDYAPKSGEKYRAALDFSVASNNAITRTIVGKTKLKRPTGQKYINPEYLLGEVMTGKPSVIEQRATQILNLSDFAVDKGFKGAEKNGLSIRQNLDAYLRTVRKELISDTKVPVIGEFKETDVPQIDQKKLDAWRKNNQELLRLFPNLDKDLSTVSSAQRLFSMWDVRNAAVKKSIKNTEYLSKMINGQHPITAIEAALKGDQPTRGMLKLFRSLKGDFEEPAKQAMGEAIINRAFINAGGTGGIINAKALYRSFYEPMPDNPSVTMMGLLRSQGIFKPDQVRQIDYITKQLIKLEIAENSGNLMKNGVINEQLLEEVGPLFDFFVAISGSAIGTRAGSIMTGGQPGPGSIIMASKGANFLRSLLINIPASEKLNLVTELFTNKQLFLNFLKKPKSEKEKIQIQNNIVNILSKGANTLGIDKSIKVAPSVIREAGEEDDIPTDETLEFIERRDMSSVEPSIQKGIPTTQVSSRQPFLSGLNTAPAGGGSSSAAPANINRAQYASLFPNDIISGMIQRGPVTMKLGGEVPNLREAPELDDLRALTLEEFKEATLKYLMELNDKKKVAYDKYVEPTKYSVIGPLYGGRGPQNNPIFLEEAQQIEQEMRDFGVDRQKAILNYEDALRDGKMVSMRSAKDIEEGNVIIRGFPDYLVNPVREMREGGGIGVESGFDMGLEGDITAQEQVQGGLDPYGDTGSDYSTDVQRALSNPQGFQKGRKTDYIKKMLSLGLADKIQKDKSGKITGIFSSKSPSYMEQFQMDPLGTALKAVVPGAGIVDLISGFINPNRQVYTGYNAPVVTTKDNMNDGGSENVAQTGVASLPITPMDQYKRSIDIYNLNPNRYKLFG